VRGEGLERAFLRVLPEILAFFDQATWAMAGTVAASAARAGMVAKAPLSASAAVARVRLICLIVVVFL
jgi:hypothetical protein